MTDVKTIRQLNPFSKLAAHPQVFPAVCSRFLTDSEISSCLMVSKVLQQTLNAHGTFWRYICHRTYRMPAYRPPKLAALETFKSWKHYWYTRPRLHTHGFYCVKISYIPRRREIPPGHIEIGSQLPARTNGEIRLVTYYRYFWFQPNGVVRHTCVPDCPRTVKKNPEGLFPLSKSRSCCNRVVNIGTYSVRSKNLVSITLPNIGLDTNISVQMKIGYEKGSYGPPPLKPLPPKGSFFMLLPIHFNLESIGWDGRINKTPMPIAFGEVFHFHSCDVGNVNRGGERKTSAVAVATQVAVSQVTELVNGSTSVLKVPSVLLSSEEEKAAAKEASL